MRLRGGPLPAPVGKPFLASSPRASTLDDGRTLHAQAGPWRADGREREGRVDGDRLTYRLRMAAAGEAVTDHLPGLLRQP